ncbi:MAG: hypothetical protein B9S32_03210 [Verrucomicrobia bacterium Tous-C9LFEB]|nr:MAG: hypothetical protein B9S32_03210 [Verrucomicrobia bacterium Tous-C9LFEB]
MTLGVLSVSALSLLAQATDNKMDSDLNIQKSDVRIAQETNLSYSYVGAADIKQGDAKLGDISSQTTDLKYVISPEIKDGLLFRGGVEWERYSFGLPDAAPLPNTLQSTNLIIGFDIQIADQWLMRVEAAPGFYSDFVDLSSRDINVPVIIGGSYLVNKDLQWVFGLSIDMWREYPVLPGAGVRWKFADQWVLNFILPKPRIEYELEKAVTLFVGGDMKGGTYMVNGDFGKNHGRGNLNQTVVEYSEVRIGGGVAWKPIPFLTFEAQTGAVVMREFNFSRADTSMKSDGAAPYGEVALSGSF